MKNNNICFLDFETTGIDLINDFPIEIGAILVDGNLNFIKEFHSLIKPNYAFKIKESALKIHNISEQVINESPTEAEVLNLMFKSLGTNYRLAAWNMSFDVSFFKALCYRNDYQECLNKLNYRHLDVQTINFIAKEIGCIPNDINSLSDLTNYMGLSRSKFHNAKEDVKLLIEVYRFLIHRLEAVNTLKAY